MRALLLAASLALGLAAPAAAQNCATMVGVLQAGGTDHTTLTQAVNAIPSSLTGDYCINILDTNTYNEQVDVRNIVTNDYRIYIGTDASGGRPVIAPPAGSTAAFLVANASVSIGGVDVVAAQSVPYGILFSSALGEILDVSVSTSGALGIYEAGVRMSSYGLVDALRIHVPNAHGLWLDGSVETVVLFSTAVVEAADKQALLISGGDFNLFSEMYLESGLGDALAIEGNSTDNYVELSTMVAKGSADAALQMTDTSGNIVTLSWMRSDAGYGAALFSGSDGNLIDFSTIVAAGSFRGLHIEAADGNIVDDCYVQHLNNYAAYILSGSELNTISDSHLYANANGGNALRVAGSSTNTVTRSRIENPSGEGAGILFGSDYNTVDASTIVSNTTNWAALRISASSANVVTGSYVQNLSTTALILEGGADRNSISRSTFVTNSAAPAARLHFADGNDFDVTWFRNPGTGYALLVYDGSQDNLVDRSRIEGGLRLDGGNSDNTVKRSTMTSSAGAVYALYMQAGSSNTVTQSMISRPGGTAAYLWRFTGDSVISLSTITGGGVFDPALVFDGAATNTVTGCYVENPSHVGAQFDGGAYSNVITLSTVTNNAGLTKPAVYFNSAATNTVSHSYLYNQSGYAVVFASSHNVLSQSTVSTGGSFPAVFSNNAAQYTRITGSYISNAGGSAVALNGSLATVSQSTLTSAAAGSPALNLSVASSNTVTGCYVENLASTAAAINAGSNYNLISFSTMAADSGAGYAMYMSDSDSNTVTGTSILNPSGWGVKLTGSDDNTISLSTMVSGITGRALSLEGSSKRNEVTGSYLQGPAIVAYFLVGSDQNTISLSTVIGGGGNEAIYVNGADSNTVSDCYIRNGGRSAVFLASGADYNSISRSTLVVTGASAGALRLAGADGNSVSESYIQHAAGSGVYVESDARFNLIRLSTVVAAGPGLYITASSSNSVEGSRVTGSTAVAVFGSTGTQIRGSWLTGTAAGASALAFSTGNVSMTLATSTLQGVGAGRGLALGAGNSGLLSIGSVTFTGAAVGLELDPAQSAFDLSVDSITLRALAPGATGMIFLSGTISMATFTLVNFEDASVAVNVAAGGLTGGSRITMRYPRGPRLGPAFENDPLGVVDWPGYELFPGCALTYNVGFDQPYATIQAAVDALPTTLSGHTCVVIRDMATYTEQVTVANFTNNGSSLTIRHHTGTVGARATVRAPGVAEAAFRILNASVNVVGLDVLVDQSIPYGIVASSGWVVISSVSVTTGPALGVTTAGISLSSWSTVSYTQVSVGGAPALRLEASARRSLVLYSTFTSASNIAAVYSAGGSTNTFDNVSAYNTGGAGMMLALGSHYNTVTRSSVTTVANSYEGLFISGSSSNTVADSYFGSLAGPGLRIAAGADCNNVTGSSMNAGGTAALYIQGAASNTVTDSWIYNTAQFGAFLDAGAHRTVIARSSVTSNSGSLFAFQAQGASSVTLDASYIYAASGGIRLRSGSSNALIMRSTAASAAFPALRIEGSSDVVVTNSFFTASSTDAAQLYPDAVRNALSNSTFSVAGFSLHALHLQGASSNTLTALYAEGGFGSGLTLDAGAHSNVVSGSTLNANGNGFALYMSGVGSNTVTGSRVFNFAGTAARIDSAAGATLSVSTVAGGTAGFAAMFVSNSSSLTFTRLNIPGCTDTCLFMNAVGYSQLSASSFTATGGISRALTVSDSSWNVITASYFGSFTGNTVRFETGAANNTVSLSTIAGNSAANPALHVSAAPSNVFSSVRVENLPGQAALFSGADYNRVLGSTVAGRDDEGLRIESSSAVWVVGSYVQGATAAYASNSYAPFLHSSVFVSVTGASGAHCAVALQTTGQATVSSNTISSQGEGACVEGNNYGLVLIASNTISARRSGVRARDQSPQTPQIWISSNSVRPILGFGSAQGLRFDNLSSGATVENNSIYFRSAGGVGGTTVSGLSATGTSNLAVRRNRFNVPDTVTAGSLSLVDLSNVNASFHNNDLHVVALNALESVYLLSVNNGSVVSRENIFSSSVSAPSASSFTVHSVGGGLSQSDFNVYHSSNGLLSFHWNGVGVVGLPAWISQSFNRDQASTVGHPYWANTGSFAEDFHPKSAAGRYDPSLPGFVNDAVDSASIDAGNPASYYGDEPSPNGFHANAGSTGGTSEASKSPAGACVVVRKVCKTGGCPYASIQSAVDSLPNPLVGHSCVFIRDASIYGESVTIASFTLAGSSITIAVDQSATTGTPVLQPSVMGGAILDIRVASVTVTGPLTLQTMAAMSRDYGVYVASPSVRLSSVNVLEASGQINVAGVALSTESSLSYSTISITNSAARALVSSASFVAISHASMSWTGGAGGAIPVFELRGASNTLSDIRVHANGTRDAALFAEVSNLTVARATFTSGGGYALLIGTAASVQLTETVITSLGRALIIESNTAGVLIDRSSITAAPGAAIAGASVSGSGHVLSNIRLSNTGSGAGLELLGVSHRISSASLTGGEYGLRVAHSTGSVVEDSFITGGNGGGGDGGGLHVLGGKDNLITGSTMSASGAAASAALRLQSTSSNTVARVSLRHSGTAGYGLYLDGASSNTVAVATVTLNGGIGGVYFGNGASSNTLSDLRVTNYGGHGLFFDAFANINVVDRATVTAMGFSSYGVGFNNASSNTLTGLVVVSTDNAGMYFSMTSNWNSVARSSVAAPGSGDIALYLANGSSNTISDSYLWAANGWGMLMSPGSRNNVVERSTMVTGSGSQPALEINQTDDNVVRRSVILSTGGYRAALLTASPLRNLIEDSEIRLTGGGSGVALDMVSGSSNVAQRVLVASSLNGVNLDGSSARVLQSTVNASGRGVIVVGPAARLEDSYVAGSTAVYVFNPSTPTLSGNRLVGTGTGGAAVYVTGGGGLDFASNTVTGPSGGLGVQLGATGGAITVSSNTFLPGAGAQFFTGELDPGSTLRIASNTFLPTIQASTNSYGVYLFGLSRGATIQHNSFVYRSPGAMTGFVTYGLYATFASGVRVDHNRYSNPGMVTAGGAAAFHFGNTAVDFRYNDVFSSGTANTAPYQVQLVNAPSVAVKNNIFANAMQAFTGQAVTLFTDAASQAAFSSDNNDFHMITGNSRVGRWSAANHATLAAWQAASGQDADSLSADPLWFSTATEDFHARSAGGRWDPLTQTFVTTDVLSSPTIDKADPADPPSSEQFPGASRANMGSYGQTAEASKAAPPAGCSVEHTVAPGFNPDIQTAIDAVGTTLTNNPCVVIRQTYVPEGNVTVPVLTTNGNRLTIMGEPGVAVTMDSGGLADGFIVAGASVTIRDLIMTKGTAGARAIRATGSDLRLSNVTVDGWSSITETAVSVTTNATVESSSFSAGGVALQLSGAGVTVLNSTAVTSAVSSAALRLDGTLGASLSGVYAGATGSTAAVLAGGAQGSVIAASTFTSASGAAFHFAAASATLLSDSFLYAPSRAALRFDAPSQNNAVIRSTLSASGGTDPPVAFGGSSSNTLSEAYIQPAFGVPAITFGAGSSRNTVSSMTLIWSLGGQAAVELVGSSSNTLTGLRVENDSGPGISLAGGSSYNLVDLSTVANTGAASHALDIQNSTGTRVARSYVQGTNNAVRVLAGSHYTLIELSTMSAQNDAAVNVQSSTGTTLRRSMALNSAGNKAFYAMSTHRTSVELSTVATAGVGTALEFDGGSEPAVLGSYVQGGRGIWFANATESSVLYSSVVALGAEESAVWFTGSSSGLRVSSSVIQGGAGGVESYGVKADAANGGLVSITTNVVLAGPRYGIMVGTQAAGGRVHVAGNAVYPAISASTESYGIMLTGVRGGATVQDNSVYFRASAGTSDTSFGIYTRDCDAVLIERNRVNQPGVQTSGGFIGIGINATPRADVRFNDVYGAGNLGFGAAFAALNSTGVVLTNNALSSWFTGASTRTLDLDAASAGGLRLGYNLYHSSAGPVTAYIGSTEYPYPFTFPLITDPDPVQRTPHWFSVTPGSEDFHPRSQAGRWDPGSSTFVNDGWTSALVDHADETEPVGAEQAPNGSRANIGSYGGTAEASRTPPAPGSPAVTLVGAQAIQVSFTDSGSPQGHLVGASTTPLFTGVTLSSQGAAGAIPLQVSGLNPNVTYYLVTGAVWGDAFVFSGVLSTPTLALMPVAAATPFPAVDVTSASVSWDTQVGNPLSVTTYTVSFSTSASFPNSFLGTVVVSSLPSVNVATATATGLVPNTTYFVFVGARNHAGVMSSFLQYTTATLAAAPTALSSGPATDTTAPLSWNANGNPLVFTTYTVLASTASDFTGAADFLVSSSPALGAGMTPGGLTPASTYYFRLRALNHAGVPSDYADVGPVVTLPLSINPPTPGVFVAGSTTALTANWSLSPGATGYTLVASTMSVSPPVDIADSSSTVGQGSTFATVDGLVPNTTYFLFVRAHGNNGNSPYAAFTATATQPSQPLSAVTTFTAVAESSFTVSWLADGNPLAMTTYTVVASTAADFNAGASSVTLSTVPASGPSATLTLLSPYTLYYVGVRALGQGTGITTMTVLGSTQTLPVSLGLPGPLATGVSASSASATWSLVAGATGYSLVASPLATNPPVSAVWVSSVAGGASAGGAVFGLSPLTTYYLFVRADGPGNSGAYDVYPATATDPLPPLTASPPFTAVNTGSLIAQWEAGADPVGVTSYTVTLSTYGVFPNTAGSNQVQTVVPAGATGGATFGGLNINATYHVYVEALSHAGARFGLFAGSTSTLADPPGAGSILKNGVSSVTVQWGLAANPAITSYTVVASTASDFNAFASSVVFTTASVSGVATVPGLSFGTTWHFQVQAVNHGGIATTFSNLGSTYTYLSNIIPLIVDNQSGDDVWRSANTALYDVDFADGSGLGLDKVQVSVSTSPGGAADLVSYVDAVIGLGGAPGYSADFGLPAAAFNAIPEGGTAYVSVRVFNLVPATNTLVDVFYVRKDTTAPVIGNFEVNGDTVVQAAAGRLYDVRAQDAASGLDAFQYSVSATPLSADESVVPWTDIAALSGATDYATPWPVAFAALRDGTTNYVSVRAVDVAGATTTVVDAFRVFKDTTGPAVSISTPNAGTGFVSDASSAGGSVTGPFGVSGASVAVQQVVGGLYWDGASFISATPVWIPATGGSSWTVAALGVAFAEGQQYRLIARGSTPYGQFSTVLATATFIFDATAPTVAVTSPTALATVASIPQLSGTAADAVAGVSSIEVRLLRLSDGQWWNWFTESFGATPVSSVTAGGAAWSVTPSALLQANLRSGSSYYVAVRANDDASPPNSGDFFLQGSTFTFDDPTPPAAVTDLAAVNGTLPGDVRLTWTAPGAHGPDGITQVGQYAVFASTDMLATPSTAAAMVIIPTGTVIPGQFQGYIGGNGLLTAGSTYFLWVALSNADGNWGAFSNQASTTATPAPSNTILGHVVDASTQGITAVRIDAYNDSGVLVATAFTVADGSGTYSVTGLSAGNHKIEASWTANGITSSVWIDGIPMGSVNIDFVLNINYALATLTGTLGALSSQGTAGLGVAGSGYRPGAEGSHVELHQRGVEVARVAPDPTGRWSIGHLLPGSYRVRAYTGLGYTDFQDVDLAEGEIRTIGFVFNPLPDATVFAFPNPARHSTTIRFETALQPLEAQISIFDLKGALVREVPGSQITATATPGLYHYVWDLNNAQGRGVASGVYLFMVKVKGGSEDQLVKVIKKLAVVR